MALLHREQSSHLIVGPNVDVRRKPENIKTEEVAQVKARMRKTKSLDKICKNLLLAGKYNKKIRMFQMPWMVFLVVDCWS